MSKKRKLTLSVSEDVIQRAKDKGLNLSQVVEDTLDGFSYEPSEELDDSEIRERYKGLFNACSSLMQQLDIGGLEIGSGVVRNEDDGDITRVPYNWSLWKGGTIHWMDREKPIPIEDVPVNEFYEPRKIMEDLLDIVPKKMEERQKRAREAKFAEDIVTSVTRYIEGQ